VVGASDAYLRATKTAREGVLGRGIFEIFPDNPDDPTADGVRYLKASLLRVLQSGKADVMAVQKYDVRKPEAEGGGFEARYWSPINSPVLGENGGVAYIVHRVEDVTEFIQLKQQEGEHDALRERASQMEAEIYARGREVAEANIKLKQANDDLEQLYQKTRELDELKTQFFANVSHELRTPLTLADGPVAKCLKRTDLPDDMRHDLDIARRNIRLLQHHVDDLLDIAKLEAGRMKVEYSELDLVRLVRFLAAHFESLAEERGITYQQHLPETLTAQVDPEKYQRIFLNLLSNAFKFTPEGGCISISLAEQGDLVVLEVRDNGPGVPEHMRSSIFERFRQVDGGLQRRHGGTGLGLAIVWEFVQLQGGSVSVEKADGGGALFTVVLPRRAPPDSQLYPLPPLLSDVADRQLASLKVGQPLIQNDRPVPGDRPLALVVEDNADMSSFIREVLGTHFRLVYAFDGKEGLEKAVLYRPDLIVTDVMMPGMSGDQMVQEIRTRKDMTEIPIIVLTAKSDEALRVRLLSQKVQDYLPKPFSADVLLARAIGLTADWQRKAKALLESEKRFQATFEQAAVGIAHLALDGRWQQINHRLCAILGYSAKELQQHGFRDVAHPDDVDLDHAPFESLLANEISTFTLDKRYLRKGGGMVWIAQTVSLVRNDDGSPAYFIVVLEDIQRRKDAEAEVRALNADLERKVAARTQALQIANQELESFAYAVSHDLRAPLRAMLGFGQAILEDCGGDLRPEGRAYLDEILKASTQMGELINGLLTLSRCTRSELRHDLVDLTILAAEIIDELSKTEPGRHVETQITPGLFAWGDRRMIESVFRNLLGNAWKYTGKTENPAIRVYGENDGGQIFFCIADNGAGFDVKFADKLFKPFSRLHRQDEFPGIGVGLATVRRIIQRHGGEIRAFGEPGQGATFRFSLPVTPPQSEETA